MATRVGLADWLRNPVVLTDLPEMTISTDRIDPDWIERPHRWSLLVIRRFMAKGWFYRHGAA